MTEPSDCFTSSYGYLHTPGIECNDCSQPNTQKNSSAGCAFFTSIKLTQLDAYRCQTSNIIYTL